MGGVGKRESHSRSRSIQRELCGLTFEVSQKFSDLVDKV